MSTEKVFLQKIATIARESFRFTQQNSPQHFSDEEKRLALKQNIASEMESQGLDLKLIGAGVESVVIEDDDPQKVKAVEYQAINKEALEASTLFHVHRLLSSLFPHNFPHFSKVTSSPIPYTERRKINKRSVDITNPFENVRAAVLQLDLPISFDDNTVNFEEGEDGGKYYLDTIKFDYSQWQKLDSKKLLDFLNTHNYEKGVQKNIIDSFTRLQILGLTRHILAELEFYLESDDSIKDLIDSIHFYLDKKVFSPIVKQKATDLLSLINNKIKDTKPEFSKRVESFLNKI